MFRCNHRTWIHTLRTWIQPQNMDSHISSVKATINIKNCRIMPWVGSENFMEEAMQEYSTKAQLDWTNERESCPGIFVSKIVIQHWHLCFQSRQTRKATVVSLALCFLCVAQCNPPEAQHMSSHHADCRRSSCKHWALPHQVSSAWGDASSHQQGRPRITEWNQH